LEIQRFQDRRRDAFNFASGIHGHEGGGAFHDEAMTGAFSKHMRKRQRYAAISSHRGFDDQGFPMNSCGTIS
jgi:hypothetical protein